MASKWGSSHEEQGNEERNSRVVLGTKRRYGHSEELEDGRTTFASSSNSTNEMALYLVEPLLRKMIQEMIPPILEEVIPPILQRYLSPCCGLSLNRQIGVPAGSGRALQLRFMNNLPSIIFTQSKITVEDGSPLRIALCDATSQELKVRKDGSSVKVKIFVLDGDFGSNGSEDWSAEEFNANILSPREGKGPLLNGDTDVIIRNGVGCITQNIVFTDNSKWTRSSTFRIGVKAMQSSSIGADIKEARTQPLRVKDNRGVAYKKHDRPSLNDKVWRLKQIGKTGTIYQQLFMHGIETVKDLLQLYTTNQASLREIIGNNAKKAWDTIIEHAKLCEIEDDERYIYQFFEAQQQQSISLVLNCIYEVVEVSFNGQNSQSLESLNLEEKPVPRRHKHLVEIVKQKAYQNLNDLKPIEAKPYSLGAAYQGGLQPDFPNAQQAPLPPIECLPPQTLPNLSQPSTSHNEQVASSSSLLPPHQLADMQQDWPQGEDLVLPTAAAYNGHSEWFIGEPQIDDTFGSLYLPLTPLDQQGLFFPSNGYGVVGSSNVSSAVYMASKGKRNTIWNKLRSAFKCPILPAAKMKAKIFHHLH